MSKEESQSQSAERKKAEFDKYFTLGKDKKLEEKADKETRDGSCVLCGHDTCDLLLTCLHTVCATCALLNTQAITCPVRSKVTSDRSNMLPLASISS